MTAAEWWWLAAVITAGLAALLRLAAARAPLVESHHRGLDVVDLAGALHAAAAALVAAGLWAQP